MEMVMEVRGCDPGTPWYVLWRAPTGHYETNYIGFLIM